MPGMNVNQHQSNFTTSPPTTAKFTPENASQLLATMQPQPPSSLGAQYFKQPSPQKSPQQQQQIHHHQNNKIMSNQKSPIVQATSTAASVASVRNNSSTNSSSFSQFQPPPQQQTSTNYVVATPMPAKSNTNMGVVSGSNYFPASDNNSANIRPGIGTSTQNIRLPTVPVPSTSVFSSGIISQPPSVSISSQQQNTTQNYMFTSNIQPAHQNNQISSQPNFSMSVVNAKPTTTNNVSNSNADLFQQYLNIPK